MKKCQDPSWGIFFRLTLYVNQTTRLMWNGVYSSMFRVLNGVKQGGVASPVMFCVYVDELLSGQRDKEVGCWFGKFFVGAIAYADDIVLLAPSASAMRAMLSVCDQFESQYSVEFNATKSKSMQFAHGVGLSGIWLPGLISVLAGLA